LDYAFIIEPTKQGIGDRFWLFEDFFQHEVSESAALSRPGIPSDLIFFWRNYVSIDISDVHSARRNFYHLILAQFERFFCVANEC